MCTDQLVTVALRYFDFQILCRNYSLPYRSTLLCLNVVKFFRRKIGEIMRYFPDQKIQNFGSLSNCCYCSDCVQNLPGPAHDSWLTLFQISSKSVYFRQSYSRAREGRSFCPTEYFHDRLFEPIIMTANAQWHSGIDKLTARSIILHITEML